VLEAPRAARSPDEQRTVHGESPPASRGAPPPSAAARAGGPAEPPTDRTRLLPDSAGIVAFAVERARSAQQAAASERAAVPPAHWTFWIGWCLVGIGMGLAAHAWLLHRAASGG
jgi:hypothetical protein